MTPPLNKLKDPMKPWYSTTPVGRNRLNAMLKEMCQEAGLSTKFTNHSLRAYGVTTLFQAGVSEKLIQQRIGHRCLEALHQYERTSESQLADVSNVISNPDTPASTNMSSWNVLTRISVQYCLYCTFKCAIFFILLHLGVQYEIYPAHLFTL